MIRINPGLKTETRYTDKNERRRARAHNARLLALDCKRVELEAVLVDERNYSRRLYTRLEEKTEEARPLLKILHRITRSEGQTWTCGDGKKVPIREMNDSHLFYAIAKAKRNEYPDSWSRKVGVMALEGEALRRLAGL